MSATQQMMRMQDIGIGSGSDGRRRMSGQDRSSAAASASVFAAATPFASASGAARAEPLSVFPLQQQRRLQMQQQRLFGLLFLFLLCCILCCLVPASALRLSSPSYPYPGGSWGSSSLSETVPGLYPHTFALYVSQDPESFNVSGEVVYLDGRTDPSDPLDNHFLCDPLTDRQVDRVRGKIVLALRGPDCHFDRRSFLARQAGAVGLIIADDSPTSHSFDPQFLGPPLDREDEYELDQVNVPTVFVLHSAFVDLMHVDRVTGAPAWSSTTATISGEGLVFTLADWYATQEGDARYAGYLKVFFVAMPLLAVAFSYYAWGVSWREARNSPQARPPQPQPQQAQAGAAAAAVAVAPLPQGAAGLPQQQLPVHAAVIDVASEDGGGGGDASSVARRADQHHFSEGEMHSIHLPVPPHLASGDTPADGGSMSISSSASSSANSSAPLGGAASSSSSSRARSLSLNDDDGGASALLARGGGAGGVDDLAEHDLASPLPGSGSAVGGARAALGRPLLSSPLPQVALSQRAYYHTLKALSLLGKPAWIFRLNALVYLVHVFCALVVLIKGWNESCINNQQSMVSLWMARALIGLRICYWQTHSSSFRPTCLDIFLKNWSDCIYLFTGSLSSFSEAQKHDCELHAPLTYSWVQGWVIVMFVSYGSKLLFYGCDRLAQRYAAHTPHVFAIAARSFLSLSQGGFSCAGALDAHQPATQLDLMLIPVVSFREGMYPPDDAVCGVCLGEYTQGEELRVLNCSHHFHKGCVDQWLQLKNTCPTCRSSIDATVAPRRPSPSPPPAAQREQGVEMRAPSAEAAAVARGERPPSPSRVGGQGAREDVGSEHHYSYAAAGEEV